MKKVSFEGVGAEYLTFKKADGADLKKDDFVSVTANGTVGKAAAGEIVGKCADICGDYVTVQVKGYMTAPVLSGQSITLGKCHMGIDSDGKAKVLSSADSVLVTEIDTENAIVGFIL